MKNSWITKEELSLLEKEVENHNRMLLWGMTDEEKKHLEEFKQSIEYYLKWAWVEINNKREMIWVHNQNMTGYVRDGYGIAKPLQEQKYDKFIRWCTSFDL